MRTAVHPCLPRVRPLRFFCAVLFALAALALVHGATAHPLAPLGLQAREIEPGRWRLALKRPTVQPKGARFALVYPAGCTPVGEPVFDEGVEAVIERVELDCPGTPLEGSELGVEGLAQAGIDAVVLVTLRGGGVHRALLTPAAPRFVVPSAPRPFDLAAGYLRMGVEHLLGGWDHLLFVIGLLFVPSARRRLVAVLTAFTCGHALTLGLAVFAGLSLPRAPVEVGIAASVLFVALSIRHEPPGAPTRRTWLTAGAFGLLHGLGFAGALADAGLVPADAPLALAAFHVGLELAQLAVVAAALALGWPARRVVPARPLFRRDLPAFAVGGLAAMWLLERLWHAVA